MDATGIPRCEWDCMERWQRPELAVIARRAAEKTGLAHFRQSPPTRAPAWASPKARDMAELEAAVDLALQHDSRVVFERFVQGQEVECAVRGNDEVSGTHPGEILASAEFYTYDDKYISGTSRWPSGAACAGKAGRGAGPGRPRLPGAVLQGLGPRGLFVEHGTQRNRSTLPGFTSISMYPKRQLQRRRADPAHMPLFVHLEVENRYFRREPTPWPRRARAMGWRGRTAHRAPSASRVALSTGRWPHGSCCGRPRAGTAMATPPGKLHLAFGLVFEQRRLNVKDDPGGRGRITIAIHGTMDGTAAQRNRGSHRPGGWRFNAALRPGA